MRIIKYLFCLLLNYNGLVGFAQQKEVDFKSAHAHITPVFKDKSLTGKVIYEFEVYKKIDTIFLDAKGITFNKVAINGKPVDYIATNKQLKLFSKYKKGKNTLEIDYSTQPKQTVYFVGTPERHQIWTQGQGKYTSHWLPSFDDVNEKVIFNISVSYPESYQVVANGELKSTESYNGIKTWNYVMQHPMSSYLAMFAIGDYVTFKSRSTSGTPLEFYLKPEDYKKYETTYWYAKDIFDFLETKIGINYPWRVYRQIPVDDFLYGGMENTTSTIFAQDFVVDQIGVNDKNYLNVNAHELAHQWFGDLVTAKENKHHWLQEGFATYYALLAEGEIFGKDYFDFELYDMAEQIIRAQQNDNEPILSEKASSLTFYKKGAWALHYLKNQIGEDNFNKAVKNFIEKFQFKNATTDDFLTEVTKVSNYDTTDFKKRWLESHQFQTKDAFEILTKNPSIIEYLEIGRMYDLPLADKIDTFKKLLQSKAYINIKEEAIYQLGKEKPDDLVGFFPIISASNDVKMRQAFVRSLGKVSPEYKSFYEQFLFDPSYITREIVFKNLWVAFPEDRISLLEKTKTWQGFNDNNLRIAWLTLALLTENYNSTSKLAYYDELLKYTQLGNESNTRQNAINNMLYINPNDTNVLESLVQGLDHHKWQYVKYCKDLIRKQLKNDNYRVFYTSLLPKLGVKQRQNLETLLNEQTSK
jgi:aminopeptidase N